MLMLLKSSSPNFGQVQARRSSFGQFAPSWLQPLGAGKSSDSNSDYLLVLSQQFCFPSLVRTLQILCSFSGFNQCGTTFGLPVWTRMQCDGQLRLPLYSSLLASERSPKTSKLARKVEHNSSKLKPRTVSTH